MGTGINGGVLEVRIPNKVSCVSSNTVEGWVDATLGSRTYRHVMYVLPESANFNGAATCKLDTKTSCMKFSFDF